MDIEKLIRRLRNDADAYRNGETLGRAFADQEDVLDNAATAISTLQAENESLKEKLYDGEGVNLVDYWMQQAKIEENGHRNCQAENEKLRAEVESLKKEHCAGCSIPAVKAEQIRDLTDAPKLRTELEQVKKKNKYSAHDVALILSDAFGDSCACNFNGNDEWLPEKCELLDTCPDVVGVACWEQYLKWLGQKED